MSLCAAADYDGVPQTVTVTFPAGQTSQTVSVMTTEDSISEERETFTVTLSNPVGGGFAVGPNDRATIDINDDDCKLPFSTDKFASTSSVYEG